MGQAFIIASMAFIANFVTTIIVSLMTTPKPEAELRGLVYSLTPKESFAKGPWYSNPVTLGIILLTITVLLNILFF